jgi:hypothetical protein
MVTQRTASSPTLGMKLIVKSNHFTTPGADFAKCLTYRVSEQCTKPVSILAAADSNELDMPIHHGASLHDEMAFLVEAGLSPTDALIRATSLTAK